MQFIFEALAYLINTVFSLYLLLVVLRFLLQWVRADFYNPISQFVVKATNPPLRLLRRVVPGYRGLDCSALVLMLLVKALEITLISLLASGHLPGIGGLLVLSVAELLRFLVYFFLFAVFIQIVLSWVSPGAYNPFTVILYRLTEPLLRPARNLLPAIGGLDLSPILVFVFLQLALILLVKPLLVAGYRLIGFVP